MRWFWKVPASATLGGLLLIFVPAASGQNPKAPVHPSVPMVSPPRSAASAPAQQPQHRVVIVEPVHVLDPFFDYPYPYAYPPNYMGENYGYVKLKTDLKEASVYVDGGYANKIDKAKKFALLPGNHEIELRDSDGRTLFQQKIAVLVGKTTELTIG